MKSEDVAYLAGLIDADGSIYLGNYQSGGRTYKRQTVTVTNTNYEVLQWIVDRTGFSKPYLVEKRPNRKPLYRWVVSHKRARNVLRMVLPYLIIKKSKAIEVLGK